MERKKREGKGGNLYTYINVSWKIIIFNKEDPGTLKSRAEWDAIVKVLK